MSVAYASDLGAAGLDPPPWSCGDCGEPVQPPLVLWQGVCLELLHAECAEHKGASLLKDSRECALAVEPGWRRRAVATVRHRLVSAESAA